MRHTHTHTHRERKREREREREAVDGLGEGGRGRERSAAINGVSCCYVQVLVACCLTPLFLAPTLTDFSECSYFDASWSKINRFPCFPCSL